MKVDEKLDLVINLVSRITYDISDRKCYYCNKHVEENNFVVKWLRKGWGMKVLVCNSCEEKGGNYCA